MNSVPLCWGLRGALFMALLGTPFLGLIVPQQTLAFVSAPSDPPPSEAPAVPEFEPFPPSPFFPAPSTPEPQLTFRAWVEPIAVVPGETATVTLVLSAPEKGEVLISATGPEAFQVDFPALDWIADQQGLRWTAGVDPLAGEPLTLTLPLRVAGEIDTASRIELEARQGERRLLAAVELWRVRPGRARIGEAGGLLLLSDRRAWVRFPGSPAAEVSGTVLTEPPAPLPYSLNRAVEIHAAKTFSGEAALTLSVPLNAADPYSLQELAAIFRYDAAAGRWEQLPTRRTHRNDAVELAAGIREPGTYAAALSTRSDVGNYEQPWAPTVTEAQINLFTGGVSWDYPIDAPAGRGGQLPSLSLSYHSGAMDALRGDLNPQASWIGLGWNLDVGYITRKIELDANFVPRYTQDFSLVFNGVSSKLIAVGGNQYRTEDERFWRIERKETNSNRGRDYWLITTSDGTQYRFGYQDELVGGDSRESAWWMVGSRCDGSEALCVENWRWNLDQITDPRGNHIRLDYRTERNDFCFYWQGVFHCYCGFQNSFCQNQHLVVDQGYVRGGTLEQITYSWPQAAHKVTFEVEARPDYPAAFDSHTGGIQFVQTFWNKERLKAIVVLSNGQSEVLRRYELRRNADDSRLLQSVQPIAVDGSRLPKTTFHYLGLAGYREECRDDKPEGGWKPWLIGVENGYGGGANFNYTAPEGLPWFQNGQIRAPQKDGKCWYRYRIRELTITPGVGPTMRTIYEYRQAAGDAPHDGTWDGDEFRGHPRVRVQQRNADGSLGPYTDTWFLQGQSEARTICGGELADRKGLEGRRYRQVQSDAAGTALAQQTQRWSFTDLGGGRHFVGLAAACNYPNGGEGPYSRVDYAYDGYGNVTREQRYGDVTRKGDEVTLATRYLYNEPAWILDRVAETQVIAADGVVELQARTAYDGQAFGAPPIQGLPTWTAQGLDRWGWVTATIRYDLWGNPIATADALNRIHRTLFDDRFHQYPLAIVNALEQAGRWKWDYRLNVPTEIVDANGAAKRLTFDAFGRLTGVIPPGQSLPSVKYRYPSGDPIPAPFAVQTETRIDPYTTPDYRRSWTIYDGLGRVIQIQQEAENGRLVVQSTAYDALGQAVAASMPYTLAATGGTYLPPAWNTLSQTRTEYDALGRTTKVIAPGNRTTRYAYRHWSQLVLDANGHQKRYEADGLGRTTVIHEYPGQYTAPDWNAVTRIATHYWYDAQDHLITVQDPKGNVIRIDYDPLGRKTAMDDPSMGHWEYRYDAPGNLIEQQDAEGNLLRFVYDPLNRLIRKQAGAALLAEYEYDQGSNGIGRRTAMTDTLGTTRWTYDAEGRLLGQTQTLAGETLTRQWTYGAAGQVTAQTLPTGEILDWSYNRRGLPQQLHSRTYGQDYLRSATYEALGRPLSQEWGNARTTTYTYAADTLRLQRLQISGGLLDFRYTYDPIGNLTAIQDGINNGQTQTFRYDAWDRLIAAETAAIGEGVYRESYQYDWMGNILTKTVDGVPQSYTYGQTHEALDATSPVTQPYRIYFPIVFRRCGGEMPCNATFNQPFAATGTSAGFRAVYDRNGSMILRVSVENGQPVTYTLRYNAENRLAAITNTVTLSVTEYSYNGDGQLLMETQTAAGETRTTLRLGDVEIERTGAERITRTYYALGGQRIAVRKQSAAAASLAYLHGDHLGSSSLATDENGVPLNRLRYRPFGASRSAAGDFPTDYRFTGQRDADMGLYDYGARFYDTALGRFIQADTIVPEAGASQTLNRYTYVNNNPLKYTDPTGHRPNPPTETKNLPRKAPTHRDILPQYIRDDSLYISQFHQFQENGTNDCGPTNLAMVISLIAADMGKCPSTVKKQEIVNLMDSLGLRIPPNWKGLGGATPVQSMLWMFNAIAAVYGLDRLAERRSGGTKEDLIQNIRDGNPVTVLLIWPDGGAHYVTIVGYDKDDDEIYYLDPSVNMAKEPPGQHITHESWDAFNEDWSRQNPWTFLLGYDNEMIIYKPSPIPMVSWDTFDIP